MRALVFRAWLPSLAAGFCLILAAGCPGPAPSPGKPKSTTQGMPAGQYSIDLAAGDPRSGTAIVVLVDTSGSMGQAVKDRKGERRPKFQIAREALEHIIQTTAAWKKDHPKTNLEMAIYSFNSGVREVLPMDDFDAARARAALDQLPSPASGTAIGRALESAFKSLYRSGCARKFVVCITDGENTSGPEPDWIARHLFARTNGEVNLQFVAFDTSASRFGFLKEVNGEVVQADDGGQLEKELSKIYQERILAEKEEPEQK